MQWFFLFFVFVCGACGTRSQADFQENGQRIASQLTRELQKVHSREELLGVSQKLTKLFDDLVDVMIAARQAQQQQPWEEIPELSRSAEQVNVRLQIELQRVCHLDGGREIIEKCQESGLNRLDAFEKQLAKKKW